MLLKGNCWVVAVEVVTPHFGQMSWVEGLPISLFVSKPALPGYGPAAHLKRSVVAVTRRMLIQEMMMLVVVVPVVMVGFQRLSSPAYYLPP